MRDLDCRAYARVGGILVHRAAIVRQANSAVESQPGGCLELIFKKESFIIRPRNGSCGSNVIARVNRIEHAIKLVVAFAEDLQSCMKIVQTAINADAGNAANVI